MPKTSTREPELSVNAAADPSAGLSHASSNDSVQVTGDLSPTSSDNGGQVPEDLSPASSDNGGQVPEDLSPASSDSGPAALNMNRCFKDGMFRLVFREKENLLSLYNAISGTDYDDPEDLILYTMEDVVYMGIKNDLGFLLHAQLGLYEHQSTLCCNMPLRGLQYFAGMYRSYIQQNGYDTHRRKVIPLPVPQYIVFYNGEENRRERWEMKLSDAFLFPEGQEGKDRESRLRFALAASGAPALECTALVLNVNAGKNRELMEKCGKLTEYAQFVACMRRHMKGKTAEQEKLEAVNAAVDECIRKGILKDILIKNRAEVVEMSFWEYNAERHLRIEKEDSYDEGFQAGIEQGIERGIASEKANTLREQERADAAETRAGAEKTRADAAERELSILRKKLEMLHAAH